RKVLKDIAFDLSDMTVRINHFLLSHTPLPSNTPLTPENFLINHREQKGHKKEFLCDLCVLCG
ncbi:MAG: hypothetical protein ABW172_12355, partial [Candidatus Binatia bacterium]